MKIAQCTAVLADTGLNKPSREMFNEMGDGSRINNGHIELKDLHGAEFDDRMLGEVVV